MHLHGIESGGGPLILLPGSLLHLWEGSFPPSHGRKVEASFRHGDPGAPATDYDRACDVRGYWASIAVGSGHGLVLGDEPMHTFLEPTPRGAVMARWRYAESDERAREALAAAADLLGRSAEGTFHVVSSPLFLFDAAERGDAASTRLILHMDPGEYSVTSLEYAPDESTAFLLHRLRHRGPREGRARENSPGFAARGHYHEGPPR